MNIQGWFPLGLAGFISLLSKGLSRVFSSITIQKCLVVSISLEEGKLKTKVCTIMLGHREKLWLFPSKKYLMMPTAAAKLLQLCLTLCNPIDGSPAGSPIPGILQARTLEWGAIAFSEWYQGMAIKGKKKDNLDFSKSKKHLLYGRPC